MQKRKVNRFEVAIDRNKILCELEYTCKPSYLKMGGGLTLEIQNGSRE